jgi:hypothetical protein
MIRIVRGRSAELSYTFYVDGNATDPTPDSASVSITRADGSTLTPSASVDNSGVGVVSITLTPAETALLDTLTVTWTATFAGQAQTFVDTVEVAGDVLFTIAEARAAIGDPSLRRRQDRRRPHVRRDRARERHRLRARSALHATTTLSRSALRTRCG